MQRKTWCRPFDWTEQGEQPWQMRHVADDQDRTSVAQELIADPPRRIPWLQTMDREECCLRIAGAPEELRGLECPDLAAVPDQIRFDASRCRSRSEGRRGCDAPLRQRLHRVDRRSNRVTVMNEQQHLATRFGPERLSGPFGLIEYQSPQALERDYPAATTERPAVIQEGHTTKGLSSAPPLCPSLPT